MRAHTWETWKLSHAYGRMGSGTTPTSSDARYYTSSDGVPWVTTAELRENYISATQQQVTLEALEDFPALRMYRPGSVMMAMYGATIGRLGMIEVAATCNQACCVFEASDRFDNRFLFYWLWHRRGDLIALSVGGGQPNLSQQDLREERALCPPFETQRRIARFLDEKTARIDGLIEKKRTLLDRLAEKRQALITRAVTKGLNPDAPMKLSGIDWIGDIPAHWDIQRLDRLTEPRRPIRYGIVLPGPHVDNGVPIIKGGDVRPIRLNFDTLSRTTQEIDAAHFRSRLKAGDIVYSIRGSFGDVELLPPELDGINLTQDAARIAPIKEVDREWLLLTLKSDAVLMQMAAGAIGATIKGINIRDLRRAILPLPPRAEQVALRSWLNSRVTEIDRQRDLILKSSILLEEYRAALITAAVAGQLVELR